MVLAMIEEETARHKKYGTLFTWFTYCNDIIKIFFLTMCAKTEPELNWF